MGFANMPPGHPGSKENVPLVQPHSLGCIVHLSPEPVLVLDLAYFTAFYEKTPFTCGTCDEVYSPDDKKRSADYDLCAKCFFNKDSNRCGWSLWVHVTSSTALHCDGCQASVEVTVSFCPYAGGCQACADKGCFTFKPKVQGDLYLDGVSVESGNYYGKWPSYRAVSFRKDLARREVICVVCNETHTTLTDSYLWADASKHMHVRDLSDGEFVCEWCRLRGCLSCGSFCTVGSDLARPGLWKIPKHFICTVCIQACSTRRDKTDVSPLFKGVRRRANDASRMHCPGCRARIEDTSLFTKDNACFYGAGCNQCCSSIQPSCPSGATTARTSANASATEPPERICSWHQCNRQHCVAAEQPSRPGKPPARLGRFSLFLSSNL